MAKKKKRAKRQDDDILATIQRVVEASPTPYDFYGATERRLRALPVLVQKVKDLKEKLHDLETVGAPERSEDVKRLCRLGIRLTPSGILEVLIADCKADIAVTEHEIEIIKKALKNIEGDEYYLAIKGRYPDGLIDEDIVE
jgi:hypothetical protein